jgi:hypothetical protein
MTSPVSPSAPVAWRLVPVEPSRKMLEASYNAPHENYEPPDPRDVWSAMLAASPAHEGMREAIARVIDPAAFLFVPGELADKVYWASRAHAFDRADAILALLTKGEGR